MMRKLFDNKLEFEINVIGYRNQGESIVFFLKTDDRVAYAGLVDCYEDESENVALELLEHKNVNHLDFVCWTHPHEDHTIGMTKILSEVCDYNTCFWLPPYIQTDFSNISTAASNVYETVLNVLKSSKRNKVKVREAADIKTLDKFLCYGNVSVNPYVFEIKSFAPDTNILKSLQVSERRISGNIYSVGLAINIGHFYIVLAGDVENRTLKAMPDFCFDMADRVDYIKIPHHSSYSSSYIIDKFGELGIASPSIATTTVFRMHHLPDPEMLNRYMKWGNNIEVYSTGNVEKAEYDTKKAGVIKTTFDILENKDVPVETFIYGNAVAV